MSEGLTLGLVIRCHDRSSVHGLVHRDGHEGCTSSLATVASAN